MSFAALCLTQVHVFSTRLGQLTQTPAGFFVFAQPIYQVYQARIFRCRSAINNFGLQISLGGLLRATIVAVGEFLLCAPLRYARAFGKVEISSERLEWHHFAALARTAP
jgi:hypothetical protein